MGRTFFGRLEVRKFTVFLLSYPDPLWKVVDNHGNSTLVDVELFSLAEKTHKFA